MKIIGEKIVLRAIEREDKGVLLEMINDPDTERMIGGSSYPVSSWEQENWIINQSGTSNVFRCIIATKANEAEGVGTVILTDIDYKNGTCQIHIKMSPSNGRGKGYGTEAINLISSYCFDEMRLNCIYAEVLSYNEPSQKTFVKCGFKKDGVLRDRVYKNGQYHSIVVYSLLKSEKDEKRNR